MEDESLGDLEKLIKELESEMNNPDSLEGIVERLGIQVEGLVLLKKELDDYVVNGGW